VTRLSRLVESPRVPDQTEDIRAQVKQTAPIIGQVQDTDRRESKHNLTAGKAQAN
jgi:hypothetical protein